MAKVLSTNLLAAATCWVAMAALGQGQTPQSTQPVFRSRADLVQIDVVVVDESGQPVRGLHASDFSVLDRGRHQRVETFEEISHDRTANVNPAALLPPTVKIDVSDNRSAQSDRLVVLVVDDLHIYRNRTDKAKELGREIIKNLGAQASMAVLFTSGEHSTQVTEDRSTLAAAVETLKGRQSWRRPHQAVDKQRSDRIDPEMSAEQALAIIGAAQETNLQDFMDNMTQYKTLEDAARMLGSGDARRKAFIMLSEGIGKDLTGMFDGPLTPCDARGGTNNGVVCYHDDALRRLMESMRQSNVSTYMIDPRGEVSTQDLTSECQPIRFYPDPCLGDGGDGPAGWSSYVRQAQHGLEIMAAASGGFAVTNTDDFTSGLSQVIQDLDHYYLLGFYPDDPSRKGYHPLDVRVPGHPKWTLRFRRGYEPGGPPAPPPNRDPLVALSAGVMPRTDLPLRFTAIPLPGIGAIAHVALALEVTGAVRDLLDADGKLRDTLRFDVLAVDEKKAKVTSVAGQAGRLTLSPPAGGAPLPEAVSYQVASNLDLAPGRYELRASAISEKWFKGGSVYLELDIPDFSAPSLALSGLVVAYAGDPRVPVAPVPTPGQMEGRASARPASALPFPPTLDRVFDRRDVLHVACIVARKNPGVAAQAVIETLDANDHVLASSVLPMPTTDRGQLEFMWPLRDLAPGAYRLRLTATEGRTTTQREIGFLVK